MTHAPALLVEYSIPEQRLPTVRYRMGAAGWEISLGEREGGRRWERVSPEEDSVLDMALADGWMVRG